MKHLAKSKILKPPLCRCYFSAWLLSKIQVAKQDIPIKYFPAIGHACPVVHRGERCFTPILPHWCIESDARDFPAMARRLCPDYAAIWHQMNRRFSDTGNQHLSVGRPLSLPSRRVISTRWTFFESHLTTGDLEIPSHSFLSKEQLSNSSTKDFGLDEISDRNNFPSTGRRKTWSGNAETCGVSWGRGRSTEGQTARGPPASDATILMETRVHSRRAWAMGLPAAPAERACWRVLMHDRPQFNYRFLTSVHSIWSHRIQSNPCAGSMPLL